MKEFFSKFCLERANALDLTVDHILDGGGKYEVGSASGSKVKLELAPSEATNHDTMPMGNPLVTKLTIELNLVNYAPRIQV